MKKLILLIALFLFAGILSAQTKVDAKEIWDKINIGDAVKYENVTIVGDLNIYKLDNLEHYESNSYHCYINAPVEFINCTFKGKVLGYNHDDWDDETLAVQFMDTAIFEKCTFEREVTFKYTTFKREVSFKGSRFDDEAEFKYSKFRKNADFSSSYFDNEANFKYTDFRDGSSFNGATFEREANFKYTKFSEPLDFKNVNFEDDANFKYTTIDGDNFSKYLLRNHK